MNGKLKALVSGMRELGERIRIARPAEDISLAAGELLLVVSALRAPFYCRETTTPQQKKKYINAFVQRRDQTQEEIEADIPLRRAKRILTELAGGKVADDAAGELNAIAGKIGGGKAKPKIELFHSGHSEREGQWLHPPTSLINISRAIGDSDIRSARDYLAGSGLIQKTRQKWTCRIDSIPNPTMRGGLQKLQKQLNEEK